MITFFRRDQTTNEEQLAKLVFCIVDTGSCSFHTFYTTFKGTIDSHPSFSQIFTSTLCTDGENALLVYCLKKTMKLSLEIALARNCTWPTTTGPTTPSRNRTCKSKFFLSVGSSDNIVFGEFLKLFNSTTLATTLWLNSAQTTISTLHSGRLDYLRIWDSESTMSWRNTLWWGT